MSSLPNNNLLYNLDGFRGEFNPLHTTGESRTYRSGDKVIFEGKMFIAVDTIIGETPDSNSSWIGLGSTRVSYRDIQPPDPEVGDMWVNSSTGKFYTFIDDGETKQFVEL